MTVCIHVHNALGRIPSFLESKILASVNEGVRHFKERIDVENVDISIVPHDFVHENTGIGGMAFGPEYCTIYVDPNNENLSNFIHSNLPAIAIHELHHVLRMRSFDYKGTSDWSGGSLVVLEGLATQAETHFGYGIPANVESTTLDDVLPLLQRLKPIAYDKKADWGWIYELNGLPWHIYKAVYPMGYFLVGAYLAKVGKSPIEALADPWEEVWEIGMKKLGL